MPRVSVCLPTYNGERYLAATLASVLAQVPDDFEVIVTDDASLDASYTLAASMQDGRIRALRNEHRLGLVGNWNRCLSLARGDYLVLFHQDDLMNPGNLAQKISFLDQHPTAAFVHSDITCIDAADSPAGGHWAAQPPRTGLLSGGEFFALAAATGNPVAMPAVMMRRSAWASTGPFDDRLAFACDLEMWLRLAGRGDVGYIAAPLVTHRLHSEQEGARFRGTGRDALELIRAFDMTFERPLPSERLEHAATAYQTIRRQSVAMARWSLRRGRPVAAARYWLAANLAGRRITAGAIGPQPVFIGEPSASDRPT